MLKRKTELVISWIRKKCKAFIPITNTEDY